MTTNNCPCCKTNKDPNRFDWQSLSDENFVFICHVCKFTRAEELSELSIEEFTEQYGDPGNQRLPLHLQTVEQQMSVMDFINEAEEFECDLNASNSVFSAPQPNTVQKWLSKKFQNLLGIPQFLKYCEGNSQGIYTILKS